MKGNSMKVLFIGGTGNISTAVSRLAVQRGMDLYLLNRGKQQVDIPGAKMLTADIHQFNETAAQLLGHQWDVVVNWIAFTQADVKNDFKLFYGRTRQYIFISSASVYQKPPRHPVITESTPLYNPYWKYSQNKIACEDFLMQAYREVDFPITIVRPSLTYDTVIPTAIGGWTDYGIIQRMRRGEKIIVHGDGTSLWTMTHAVDFAKGFVGLLGHQQAIGHAFHITSDEILTWDQIYQTVAAAAGVEAQIVHIPSDFLAQFNEGLHGGLLGDKAYSGIFDNTKIKTFVPGYQAVIPFNEGIRGTLRWFEADPQRMRSSGEDDLLFDHILKAYEKAIQP
jgi:nucleoside-diphosphate-sugar epimerase